nr:PREDICTED: uncharacterized protein LOC105661806 isoform X2 [Megachile rotundata]
MNEITNFDDFFESLSVEDISPKHENTIDFKIAREVNKLEECNLSEESIQDYPSPEKYENAVDAPEYNVEDCNDALNLNKQLISSLLDLKRHINFALQKCEKKLAVIETSLQKHAVGDAKVLVCNAGIPYFKDRNYFFPTNNEDEIIKESQKELQLRNLPKVCPWTMKERNTLLDAVKEEAYANVLCPQKEDDELVDDASVDSSHNIKYKKKNDTFPTDFSALIGPLKEKEFDWFKISSIHFDDIHSSLDCRVMWNVFLHPDINKNVWTKLEDVKLKEIAKKHKFQNWDKIAEELDTNRTAYQCFIRWTYSIAPYLTKGRFTKNEDRLLKDAVSKFGTNFRKISAALMPNRSTVQLHDRYETLTNNQIENWRVWTFAEDSKLMDLYARFGPNWSRIAKAFSHKTRTQLRHRHAALQKHIKRGKISMVDLRRKQYLNANEVKKPQTEEVSCNNTFDHRIGSFNKHDNNDYDVDDDNDDDDDNDIDNNDDDDDVDDNNVDIELIKYFHEKQQTKPTRKTKFYTSEELMRDTKNLYDILQQLNAKLFIPDNVTAIDLNDRDQQLLCSLREYAILKSDQEKRCELIDKYSLRMFGENHNKQGGSYFIPPPPFDSRVKLKKSVANNCIDYNLDINNKFLLEKPIEMDTPHFVISQIGGHEQQLQFQKISRCFRVTNASDKWCYLRNIPIRHHQRNNDNSINRNDSNGNKLNKNGPTHLDYEHITMFNKLSDRKDPDTRRCAKLQNKHKKSRVQIVQKNYSLFNMPEETYSLPTSETEVTTDKDVPAIQATHATVSSLKNIIVSRRSTEKYMRLNKCIAQRSYRGQEALKLLETRLEQLFRYPIGLSKTALPEVYVIDTMEDINSEHGKRKTSEVSDILELSNKKVTNVR